MRNAMLKKGLVTILLLSAVMISAQNRIYGDFGSNYKKYTKNANNSGLYTDQYDGVHHLIGLQGDVGYSSFLSSSKAMQVKPGGYTLGAALQYAYLNGSFFLQTGFGIRWQDVSNEVLDQQVQKDLYDATGTLAHMTYDFTNRVDKARAFYIQVPFYVGAYVRGAYILIGPKFTMPMFTSTQLDLIATSTARYDGFIGPIEEMDNHGIRKDVPLTPNQKQGKALDLGIDVTGVVEVGYELAFSNKGKPGYRASTMRDQRLRIGAFAEVGIMNIAPTKKLALNEVPNSTPYDFQAFEYNHVAMTREVTALHNLFCGVRVTYFFYGYQTKEKCLLCNSRGKATPW